MQIENNIFAGSRAACKAAIITLWIVEALFLIALTIGLSATLLGGIDSPISSGSSIAIILATIFIGFISFAFTGVCVAVIANAVSNIDSRNMQAELFQLRSNPNQNEVRDNHYPVPRNRKRFFHIQSMDQLSGIRAERVT